MPKLLWHRKPGVRVAVVGGRVLMHAYTGTFYHELQVGPLVIQVRKRNWYRASPHIPPPRRVRVWFDPDWRTF